MQCLDMSLYQSDGDKKQMEIKIICYFKDQHGADEICSCVRLVEIRSEEKSR